MCPLFRGFTVFQALVQAGDVYTPLTESADLLPSCINCELNSMHTV